MGLPGPHRLSAPGGECGIKEGVSESTKKQEAPSSLLVYGSLSCLGDKQGLRIYTEELAHLLWPLPSEPTLSSLGPNYFGIQQRLPLHRVSFRARQ